MDLFILYAFSVIAILVIVAPLAHAIGYTRGKRDAAKAAPKYYVISPDDRKKAADEKVTLRDLIAAHNERIGL